MQDCMNRISLWAGGQDGGTVQECRRVLLKGENRWSAEADQRGASAGGGQKKGTKLNK